MKCIFAAGVLSVMTFSASAGTIVGGWWGTNLGQAQSTAVFVFLDDGQYVEVEHGSSILDSTGHSGMERGTYTWNAATGAFTSHTDLDTNGEWGLSNVVVYSALVNGGTLTAVTSDGTFALGQALVDPTSRIVGSWVFRDIPQAGDLAVLSLLPNGTFLSGIDPPGTGYMEFGTYSWDSGSGALSSALTDTTAPPDSVIDVPSFTSASVVNNTLALSSNSLDMNLSNAATPEPGTYSFAILGLGFVGLILRRRRPPLPL